jgi:uncharacterized 2Fe-2S/4Fe-4S cluster protein (DUF4445 family)
MPTIVFTPSARTIEVPPGTLLLEAVRMGEIEIDTPCGGKGSCGKCIVHIVSGDYKTDSLGILPKTAVAEGYVLACRTRVLDSTITVEVTEPVGRIGGQFLEDENAEWLVHEELLPKRRPIDPLVQKMCLDVPKPRLEDGLSDLDRLTRCIQREWGKKQIGCPLSVVQSLADALRKDAGKVTVTMTRTPAYDRVIDVEPGDRTAHQYGIAVDVGTTTVAVQLISLPAAQILATRADYNAQISCGLDVISRIQYARNLTRREELRIRALSTISNLIRKVAHHHGLMTDEIRAAVIAGNTTMVHLLLGLNPEYIRLEPYTPTLHEAPYFTADEVGLQIHPQARIFICPSVGSYVGGDITAGLLCTELVKETESVHLFMDIGTNGELAIGNRDFLVTCACSAGPAFEGGGIENGMRAAFGAIERVDIDPETGVATVRTIGGGRPVGICGSGMISLLANLFLTGWIDQAGKLNRSKKSPAIRIDGRRAQYVIVPEKESGTNQAIAISELDIENVIRAKAAIYSAICLLLDHIGIGMDRIQTIYIAGGFGRFLDLEDATTIGLIPDLERDRFRFIGNASLMGAYLVLVSQEYRERLSELSRRMTYIELNTNPNYMNQYTGATFLPHTDIHLFPSVQRAVSNKK